jgi:small subunit ribosomal protein S18
LAERRDRGPRRRGGFKFRRRKKCSFCVDRIDTADYKDAASLRQYITNRGRIKPRRKSGLCAKHQRRLALAVKRARHIALLPYTAEHIRGS